MSNYEVENEKLKKDDQNNYRPFFHFSPIKNWMNDPNGLVYLDGIYHLFFQHYPDAPVHGPMHWGHAVSYDLINWEQMPIALYPDKNGFIFSGNAIVDTYNESGLKNGTAKTMIAYFTHATEDCQMQSMAFSNDKGLTWHKYEGNPIIKNPGIKDFRDPFVFRHDESGKWIMVLAVNDRVYFYSSINLIEWFYESEFGENEGAHGGVWECPWIKEFTVQETGEKKWVLVVSIGNEGPCGGSGTQYFIGEFDGSRFRNDNTPETILWFDYGKDNYAAIPWSNISEDDGRTIVIGWMNNWVYAEKIPTEEFRGAATLPRELYLSYVDEVGYRLLQKPVREVKKLRGKRYCWSGIEMTAGSDNPLKDIKGDLLEIIADINVAEEMSHFCFRLRKGNDQYVEVGYDHLNNNIYVDRSKCGETGFHSDFSGLHKAPRINSKNNNVLLHIFLDRSSIEVFADDGSSVITDLIFPDKDSTDMELLVKRGSIKVNTLSVYPLMKGE